MTPLRDFAPLIGKKTIFMTTVLLSVWDLLLGVWYPILLLGTLSSYNLFVFLCYSFQKHSTTRGPLTTPLTRENSSYDFIITLIKRKNTNYLLFFLELNGSSLEQTWIPFIFEFLSPKNALCERKWAHKIGKLQETPTRNIPCLNV